MKVFGYANNVQLTGVQVLWHPQISKIKLCWARIYGYHRGGSLSDIPLYGPLWQAAHKEPCLCITWLAIPMNVCHVILHLLCSDCCRRNVQALNLRWNLHFEEMLLNTCWFFRTQFSLALDQPVFYSVFFSHHNRNKSMRGAHVQTLHKEGFGECFIVWWDLF